MRHRPNVINNLGMRAATACSVMSVTPTVFFFLVLLCSFLLSIRSPCPLPTHPTILDWRYGFVDALSSLAIHFLDRALLTSIGPEVGSQAAKRKMGVRLTRLCFLCLASCRMRASPCVYNRSARGVDLDFFFGESHRNGNAPLCPRRCIAYSSDPLEFQQRLLCCVCMYDWLFFFFPQSLAPAGVSNRKGLGLAAL